MEDPPGGRLQLTDITFSSVDAVSPCLALLLGWTREKECRAQCFVLPYAPSFFLFSSPPP